jgi:endonuclease/exonuclease/phosphatase (EEP) superfamily protein YafD
MILKAKLGEKILIILLGFGAFSCIYPAHFYIIRWWSHYAMQISLFYWALGLVFLVFRQHNLMLYTFVITAFLCMGLKIMSNKDIEYPEKTNMPTLKIAHFNLSYVEDVHYFVHLLRQTKLDVVSVQETTPIWDKIFRDSLQQAYPNHCVISSMGLYGIGVYSKYPFIKCDTFYSGAIPNIVVNLKSELYSKQNIHIVSSYIAPPLYQSAYKDMQKQLKDISLYIKKLNGAIITVGDYNLPPTSGELGLFRFGTDLNDSRHGYRPVQGNGMISLFEVPIDHLYYSKHFQCIDFQTINGFKGERIGITGVYQFMKDSFYVEQKN